MTEKKDRHYSALTRQEQVVDMLKKHAGDSAIIVGRGPMIQRLRGEWIKAVSRHRAYWLLDEIPPEGITVKGLRDLTGGGKKRIRSRLRTLEAAGLVEQREIQRPHTILWFRKDASPAEAGPTRDGENGKRTGEPIG